MARLIWALFCENQTTGEAGKNSYHDVFDAITVRVTGTPAPMDPPPHTLPFVLALNLTAEPGSPVCKVHIRDTDGNDILAPMQSKLPESLEGSFNLHLRFPEGIPVKKSGIYSFDVFVEGERIGVAEIPVSLDVAGE
jgi:hypothetical protein